MDLVIKGENVYIKDTGVSVLVTDMNVHKGNRTMQVQIRFEQVPTRKAIAKCQHFHVRVHKNNRGPAVLGGSTPANQTIAPPDVNIDAHIEFKHLSDIPYESKAARTLYKRQK